MGFYQLDFYSETLKQNTDVLIACPEEAERCRYAVYLLHGGGGGQGADNKSWLNQKERLEQWAETYGVVLIMPSSKDGFFANTHSGIPYETYVTQELRQKLPVILNLPSDREHTAVAGMSMGGYASFRLGLAAPEAFGAICCISAGNLWVSPLSNRIHKVSLKPVFGVERIEDIRGTEHDFFTTALRNVKEHRPLPYIFHACGKQDHALEHARPTAAWFRENAPEYRYDYHEEEVGSHNDNFFSQWLPEFLKVFTQAQ